MSEGIVPADTPLLHEKTSFRKKNGDILVLPCYNFLTVETEVSNLLPFRQHYRLNISTICRDRVLFRAFSVFILPKWGISGSTQTQIAKFETKEID